MNTLEIEILRRELLRDILNVDDVEVLKKIRRSLDRLRVRPVNAVQEPEELRPYTMEELNKRIDEAEAEIEAGETLSSQELFAQMEHKYPWLCK